MENNAKRSIRPTIERGKQSHNEAIAINKVKCKLNLDKPIYVGVNILDLTMILMQFFHCNYVKK